MHAVLLIQCGLETLIGLLDIKGKFPRLILAEFFSRPHLIERDQPLDDLATILKFSVRHFIDRLDNLGEQWVQSILRDHVQFQCIEESNKVLRCCQNETARCTSGSACGPGAT